LCPNAAEDLLIHLGVPIGGEQTRNPAAEVRRGHCAGHGSSYRCHESMKGLGLMGVTGVTVTGPEGLAPAAGGVPQKQQKVIMKTWKCLVEDA